MVIMDDSGYANLRWRRILPRGFVGQQCFVSFPEVLRAIRTPHGLPRSLLDAGCGAGAILCQLVERYGEMEAVGVDCRVPAIREARRRAKQRGLSTRLRFKVGDFDKNDGLPVGQWEAVLSLDALQHSHDLEVSLNHIVSRWDRRGVFYATLWCFERTCVDVAKQWGCTKPWNSDDVTTVIRDIGQPALYVVELSPRFIRRLAGSLSGLESERDYFVRRWGAQSYERRRVLEETTLKLARAGQIYQVEIRGVLPSGCA